VGVVEAGQAMAHVGVTGQVEVLHKNILMSALFQFQGDLGRRDFHVRLLQRHRRIALQLHLLVAHLVARHCYNLSLLAAIDHDSVILLLNQVLQHENSVIDNLIVQDLTAESTYPWHPERTWVCTYI
jgi:hypothetical protein